MADASSPDMFAIVTTDKNAVSGGMAPIFFAPNEVERDRIAMWLCRITNATVHDLHNGTVVLTVSRSSSSSS